MDIAVAGRRPPPRTGCDDADSEVGPADPSLSVHAIIGIPLVGGGPAYTFQQVVTAISDADVPARLYAPIQRASAPSGKLKVVSGIESDMSRLPYRLLRHTAMTRIEDKFARACAEEGGDTVAYLWSELSLGLARRLARQKKTFVVREKINCGKKTARRIVAAAYASLDAIAHLPKALSDERIEKEGIELRLADAIFCPSPMVRDSLVEIGIPEDRLISSSYGFEPERMRGDGLALAPIDGVTLLFVGSLCVRKGAHILLESWEKAGVDGRLVIVGHIEPFIAKRYAHVLARPDVELHGFQKDVGAYFRSADYFIFPTLEEGSPLVTYEAGSCGLPAMTTPMGAGAFLRHGIEGIVIDPAARDDWVDVIRSVRHCSKEQETQSLAAQARAAEFTWEAVGRGRREQLLAAFG